MFLLNLAYTNALIGLTAAAQTWVVMRLLGMPPSLEPPLLAFACIYFVYTFAKTIHFDPKADAVNDPERTALLLRWRVPLIVSAFLAYGAGLWTAGRHDHFALGLMLFPVVVALFYDLKFLPATFRYRRLKDIPGVKSLVVAVTVALLTVLLPLHLAGVGLGTSAWILLLWTFVRFFINTVYFDLGDIRGDALEGVMTLPRLLGFRVTREMLMVLNTFGLALIELAVRNGALPPSARVLNLTSLYGYWFLLAARDEDTDLGFLCDVVVDGEFCVAAILMLLFG
jgi:4-hydroxybenzoate polyprenyltransferase